MVEMNTILKLWYKMPLGAVVLMMDILNNTRVKTTICRNKKSHRPLKALLTYRYW